MPVTYRKYGPVIEITEFEKEPPKVRVHRTGKRRTVFGARRPDNIRRTRQTCVRRVFAAIEDFGSPLLVTLTFGGDASDASYANDALRRFQVRLRSKFANAQSLFVPELSPRGRIHFHGLIFNVPLSLGDSREGGRVVSYGDERKTRIIANLWGEGFVDAKQTDGSGKLAYYISKYITKGAGQVMFNAMRLLRISHGFPKEIYLKGWIAEEAQRQLAPHKPIKEWSDEMLFLGKINRKTYLQYPLK